MITAEMDETVLWLGLATVVSLLLSGLLGAIESAVSTVSRARVEQMHKDDVAGSAALLHVIDNRATNINILVMLRTLLDTSAAVLAGVIAVHLVTSDAWAIFLAIVVVSLITSVWWVCSAGPWGGRTPIPSPCAVRLSSPAWRRCSAPWPN